MHLVLVVIERSWNEMHIIEPVSDVCASTTTVRDSIAQTIILACGKSMNVLSK